MFEMFDYTKLLKAFYQHILVYSPVSKSKISLTQYRLAPFDKQSAQADRFSQRASQTQTTGAKNENNRAITKNRANLAFFGSIFISLHGDSIF